MASADETRAALVAALERLAHERPLSEISVRDIAAEAGVNHGLVHRYFGSKDNLIRAATERIVAELRDAEPEGMGNAAIIFRYLTDRPHLVQVLAHACLDGQDDVLRAAAPEPDHLCAVVERLRSALDGLGLPATPDPQVLNAYAIASILGWVLFKPMLEAGYGIGPDADAEVEGVLQLLDLAVGAEL